MNKLLLFLICIFALFSCFQGHLEDSISKSTGMVDVSNMKQGHIRIKITDAFAANIEQQADQQGRIISTMVKSSDDILSSLGVKYLQRVFPYAGRFEARTRKEGLHLWYDVYFNNETPLTRANEDMSEIEGVSYIEYVPKIVPIRSNLREVIDIETMKNLNNAAAKNIPYFNDPLFVTQWHYQNDGSRPMSIQGSDINIVPAWKNYTTGNRDVIVAVVDGGIDVEHEDLKDNIWENNYGEHGWNFVTNSSTITPNRHGTHVAGTIGAVNNNGKGVAGIAGGDAKKGIKGVRLMSCQIFEGEEAGDGARAIVYGANAGAVISQNSWAYDDINHMPQLIKEAIDYFIKYAGMDEAEVQVGPMKGGIVMFAAGNENLETSYPSQYEKVMAVSAVDASFKKTVYSNYGDWVDIAAPGGATEDNHFIVSTLPANEYGLMEGTSMACPHVSGVAALLISKLGGPGFTNEMLWDKLLFTANDKIYNYNELFIGDGLLDANAAFQLFGTIAPNKVTDLKHSIVSNNINLEYSIPQDPDNEKLFQTTIYYSKLPFQSDLDRSNLPQEVYSIDYKLFNYKEGDKFTYQIPNLDFSTKYYLAVDTQDKFRNISELSDILEVTTSANNPPEVILIHDDLILNINDKEYEEDMSKYFYDPDNEQLKYTITSSSEDLFTTEVENNTITYTLTKVGSSNIKIIARDGFGGAESITFNMLIRDFEKDIDIYPNPVLNALNFRMGHKQDAIVSIYGASGSMLIKEEITIFPFAPAQIDLTSLNAGSYMVVVNYDSKETRTNVVKL